MRSFVYRLFMLAGIVVALWGAVSGRAQASVAHDEGVTANLEERPLIFSDLMPGYQDHLLSYHYSHSSHSSHYSHSSHRSHYSSRW
ncbi:hypothetical protein [Mailhella massiliensis]|uniref:Uncharacterized protein n=1 Tax=Mailhella massiliensis TaxID=1903261 RepID=A0A921AVR0_9BACT|nr:hypothetical protein [Mailhella massiliensis]HJD97227.1 hypothetical protein [Mailhella massiliensis]